MINQRKNSSAVVLVFGIFFTVLTLLAIAAPIFEHLGATQISRVIYSAFGFLCHQMHTRSNHLFDLQIAVCNRCLFMYIAMAASAFVTSRYSVKRIPFIIAVALILPAAADGTAQLVSSTGLISTFFYSSNNLLRAITGTLYGLGLGFFLFPLLLSTEEDVK